MKPSQNGNSPTSTHYQFYQMIRPALWEKAQKQDVLAVLKRAVFIVITKKCVYTRPASEHPEEVRRLPLESYDLLAPACKPRLNAFKNGNRSEPEGFADSKKWEAEWVDTAFRADWPAPAKEGIFLGKSVSEQL